jgi:hypothetical protein
MRHGLSKGWLTNRSGGGQGTRLCWQNIKNDYINGLNGDKKDYMHEDKY